MHTTLAPTIAAIDQAIDSALRDRRIVGTVVLLAHHGDIVHSRAAGMADREAGREMTPDTWIRYASVSKPFTTVAALRLIQDGRLSPDDAVTGWLPDFAPALADGSRPRITVGQLMAHLAGLDYGFNQPQGGPYARAGVSDGISESQISLAENLRRIASVPLDIVPGTEWRYSIATDVLGAVIEAVTGMPLPFAMAELVTGPLALDAAFGLTSPANLAAAYADATPEPRLMQGVTHVQGLLPEGQHFSYDPDRILSPTAYPSGGGGMVGTAAAALALLETLRIGGLNPDFLSSDMRIAASAPRMTGPHPLREPGWSHAWAGAVVTEPTLMGAPLPKGTLSWGGIYGHGWFVDPERERVLVALTNTAVEGMSGQFAMDIARAFAL